MDKSKLTHYTRLMRTAAEQLLDYPFDLQKPFVTLTPLGVAFFQLAVLFGKLFQYADWYPEGQFVGDKDEDLNLYTGLASIRDLCSASIHTLRVFEERSHGNSFCVDERVDIDGPGEQWWAELINGVFCNSASENSIAEVCLILDHVFGSASSVAEIIARCGLGDRTPWGEIYRHVCHIRDHFDHGETALLEVIKQPEE
ncbi:MAG: hypothetical protein H5T92_00985 [Synergistales bacterium]|nr:hypothetical protein [Synergistales bacterium]